MSTDFSQLFDDWSATYDQTVAGEDVEYRDVFKHYEELLDEVAEKASGKVLEFGVGTGNLTEKLINKGRQVYGIEPSTKMRAIAQQKLPDVQLIAGDFLQFQEPGMPIDSIVSTFAFHHLTDKEKASAIEKYRELLNINGKIIFGDTIFKDEEAKQESIRLAENKGYHRLANDLKTEFYTTIPIMSQILKANGFTASFLQKNDYVWIMEAVKG